MKKVSKRERNASGALGFHIFEKECIWMKAGIVTFKICNNAFDCIACPFDKAMQKAMDRTSERKGKYSRWGERLRDGGRRPCRHSLSGRIEAPKICPMNYECYHCQFDQMLDEVQLAQPEGRPSCRTISGFGLAEGYYLHRGHGWAKVEHGGLVRIGLDDFASRVFGPPDALALPRLGARVVQGEIGWSFYREDNRAEVLSPVSGVVLAINCEALEKPALAQKDPYQNGWMFAIEPFRLKENLKALCFGNEGILWMEKEVETLLRLTGADYAHLLSTGAEAVEDVFGQVSGIGWRRLVERFLRT